MNLFELLFLAVALAIDAGIISFSHGLICTRNRRKNAFLLASFTGFFQFLMPIFGFIFASLIYDFVKSFSSLVASAVFFILGIKFIYDAIKEELSGKKEIQKMPICLSLSCLLMLALATSVDALAAGVNFCFLRIPVFKASFLIGLVTFLISYFSFWLGNLLKNLPVCILQIFAGLILIMLAAKTFVF